MSKWILAIMLMAALLFPLSAAAQNAITISSMEIDIWPEFDQPGVLVIYHIAVPATAASPVTMSVRIPAAAGEPNAVAELQSDGKLYDLKATTEVNGDWESVNFTTSSSEIQIEYYDPSLVINGAGRQYQFTWPGDYAISQLTIHVQQPATATNMRISPSFGGGTTGSDGLLYFSQDIGAVAASQAINITISYQNPSGELSAQNMPVQPSAPISQSTSSEFNLSGNLGIIFGGLGAALIIGGIIWYWRSGRQRPTRQARKRRSRASAPAEATINATEEAVYCSQCGKRALPGDQFCRSCGTPIRNR